MTAESQYPALPDEVLIPLLCARIHLGTGDVALLKDLLQKEHLNWDLILAAARWHRLDPIMYRILNENVAELVPPKALEALTAFCDLNAKRHLFLSTWLIRLMELFKTHQIPALCMKGIPLANMLYDNPSLRPSQDLDILVSAKDLPTALDLLQNQGFHNTREPRRPIPPDLLPRVDYQADLANEHVAVDLHWYCGRYPELFPREEQDYFVNATAAPLAGKPIPIFEPNEMLIYLAFHGSKHLWMRWFWLMDIALLANRVEDWDALIQKARDMGQLRSLLLTFYMVEKILGQEMPNSVRSLIQSLPSKLAMLFQYHLDASHEGSVEGFEIPISRWTKTTWTMKLQPSLWSGFKVFARFLLQPGTEDLMAVQLPRALFPLYYVLRPFRIMTKELLKR